MTRWTIKMLKEMDDNQILAILLNERLTGLNPHTPFAKRLRKIRDGLECETPQGTFPLADRLTAADRKANDFCPACRPRAKATGEFRSPKKGEWYLSGAVIQAYRAPNNLGIEFFIAQLTL